MWPTKLGVMNSFSVYKTILFSFTGRNNIISFSMFHTISKAEQRNSYYNGVFLIENEPYLCLLCTLQVKFTWSGTPVEKIYLCFTVNFMVHTILAYIFVCTEITFPIYIRISWMRGKKKRQEAHSIKRGRNCCIQYLTRSKIWWPWPSFCSRGCWHVGSVSKNELSWLNSLAPWNFHDWICFENKTLKSNNHLLSHNKISIPNR
jgi:hypothetical protein